MKFRQAFICLSIVFVFLIAGCKKPAEAPVKMSDVKVNVETASAVQQDVQLTASCTGTLVPVDKVDIVPRTRGFLKKVHYNDGEIVDKGQLLFTMESINYYLAVQQAKEGIKASKSREIKAHDDYVRAVQANKKDASVFTENQIITYRSAWGEAAADLVLKIAQYANDKQQLLYTNIYSPIKGKVSKKEFTPGQFLDGTGPTPPILCTVTSMDPIYVEFDIPDHVFVNALREAQALFDEENEKKTDSQPQQQAGSDSVDNSSEDDASETVAKEISESEVNNQTTAPTKQAANDSTASFKPVDNDPAVIAGMNAGINNDINETYPNKDTNQFVSEITQAVDDVLIRLLSSKDENNSPSAVNNGDTKNSIVIPMRIVLSNDSSKTVYQGSINYNASEADASTGTMPMRGVIDNPDHQLYPGLICTVLLDGKKKKDVVTIEERAICYDLTYKYVWTLDENNVASKRSIVVEESFEENGVKKRILAPYSEEEVVTSSGEKAAKKTGLQPGETYIVEGFQKVREGMTVTLKQK